MRVIEGSREARKAILERPALETRVPAPARERIRTVFGADLGVEEVVERILAEVRREGDRAVRRYNREIDGVELREDAEIEVPREEIKQAYSLVDAQLVEALRLAAGRIEAYHRRQLKHAVQAFQDETLGQRVRPLQRIGIYVPGTQVVYPSTVLMIAVPARVAGVSEIIMATPVRQDGSVAPEKLVAADIAGVDRVFRAGGVQAIAALASGTEAIPRVDKICGPGNIFVTAAKRKVFGEVGIDGVFGPSETLIIADGSADPSLVAADLLAGAEHDELATAILLTTSKELALAVEAEVERQLGELARSEVARTALEGQGAIAVVSSLEEAANIANQFGPEHLCLHLQEAEAFLEKVTNAGCVFLGGLSVESIGDYTAGPSHVLPTSSSARFSSPLGVWDFLKVTNVIRLRQGAVEELGPAAASIARAEGLTGHALAIERRLGSTGDGQDE
ncbi:MAG TPA: histidinol dehydrogenase [Dehalococcoidia bacterium]|nr:histidinol dehydrogenase [Dehalococcoidia bacterium]